MQEASSMIRQIESVPELMSFMEPELKAAVEHFLKTIDIARFRKILLTGCGDSLCAAMAAKFVFMEYTDLEVETVSAIDLARVYSKRQLTGNGDCLVLIVSNSGKVTRLIELAKRVRRMGGWVAAVTGNENSGLYQNADGVIKMNIPPFDYAPGIRSYCGCLMALYLLAVAIGRQTGVLTETENQKISSMFSNLPQQIAAYMETWEMQAKGYAEKLKDSTSYEFIASGSQYASAFFGYAKALETTGKPASALNTEDWFHMNFFVRDVYHTATLLFVNRNEPSRSRALELIRTAEKMGRPLICITDDEQLEAREKICTPALESDLLHTLIQYLPVSMILSEAGDLLGEVYFRDGKDNWSACVNCATLINTEEYIVD